jgi:hypothetical protein
VSVVEVGDESVLRRVEGLQMTKMVFAMDTLIVEQIFSRKANCSIFEITRKKYLWKLHRQLHPLGKVSRNSIQMHNDHQAPLSGNYAKVTSAQYYLN